MTNSADKISRSKLDVYAIYLRKSRQDDEAESIEETLRRHKNILTDLAARKGLYVGEIYQEVVSGAESVDSRPEIQRLIRDCYAGKWRGIIVIEITRLSRGSQGDAQKIMDCLKYSNMNNGVLVVTPTKTYDIAHNSDDEEYMEFELFMSRREYKMINKRMTRGKLQCIVEGEYMSSYRPYGWEVIKVGKKRTLKPKQDEYEIGKMIYAWKNDGLTPYKIAERLTSMGVPTYTGGAEWSKETVKDFLRNPVNMGKVRWNDRMQVKVMADGELQTTRPRSNHTDHYMLYDGIHKKDAMVTEEEWIKANKSFRSDRTKGNLKLTNILAGLLVCKNCGKVMVYQAYAKRETTAPRYLHKQSSVCKVKSAIAEDVLKAVAHSLRLYIEDFELKIDGMPAINEDALELQIESLNKELRKTKRILEKLHDDYEAGDIYTPNEFVERKAKHNEKIASIQEQIAALEDTIPEKEEYEDKILKLTDALAALEDDALDVDAKNEYLKEIVDRIEFSRENGEEFILDVYLK